MGETINNAIVSDEATAVPALAKILECSTGLIVRALATGMSTIQIRELDYVGKKSGHRLSDAVRAIEKITGGLRCDVGAAQIYVVEVLDAAGDTGLGVDTCADFLIESRGVLEIFHDAVEHKETRRDREKARFIAFRRIQRRRYIIDNRRPFESIPPPLDSDDEEEGDTFDHLSSLQ